MKPEAFIYLWRDSTARKFYLGYHKGTPDDNYAHSSAAMESFNMSSIPEGFSRRILATGTPDEMMELENKLLTGRKERGSWDKYHNIATSVFPYMWDDPEYCEMMSQMSKEQWADPEFAAMMQRRAQRQLKKLWADPEYKKRFAANAGERSRERWADPEYREKQTNLFRERTKTMWDNPEYREKMKRVSQENNKKLWADPEYREKMSNAFKKKWKDPEYRKSMVEQTKKQHKDPVYIARMQELWADPEFREKISGTGNKALKDKWENDPEFKAKQTKMLRGLNKVRATCYVCGHESSKPSISRWHNDRCKHTTP